MAETLKWIAKACCEVMPAGVPAVALGASGARELIDSECNGRLLESENQGAFLNALRQIAKMSPQQRQRLNESARRTAESVSERRCAERLLEVYQGMLERERRPAAGKRSAWEQATDMLASEWELWKGRLSAASEILSQEVRGKAGK